MSDFYFCESFEAAGILVEAGFGVSVLPQLFIPPNSSMIQIPLENTKPMSLDLYYKTLQQNEPLKHFIRLMKENLENLQQWQDMKFNNKKGK